MHRMPVDNQIDLAGCLLEQALHEAAVVGDD